MNQCISCNTIVFNKLLGFQYAVPLSAPKYNVYVVDDVVLGVVVIVDVVAGSVFDKRIINMGEKDWTRYDEN